MNIVTLNKTKRQKTPAKIVPAILFLALMTGCQTAEIEENAVEDSLSPAAAPRPDPVGTVYHVITNGEQKKEQMIAQEGTMHTFQADDGCQWTEDFDRDPVFAPEVSWRDCTSTGKIDVSSKSGGMWPLKLGSSVNFKATGTSSTSTSSWPADFKCEAVDSVRITVAAGTFDTYKVECKTPWRAKTMYYAPSIERVVRSSQHPRNGSHASRYESELVSVELP